MTDFSEFKYKHFTRLLEGTQNPLVLYNAVCVSECPTKGNPSLCMTNEDEPECEDAMYDTELQFGYCLPAGDDVQEALA